MTKPKDNIYPNSPLAEVIFEVRFTSEPAIECRRDEFYDSVRRDYPLVVVPREAERAGPLVRAYRFEREDNSAGVTVALNSFAYFMRQYQGFDFFRSEMLRLFQTFKKLYHIGTVLRIGWRYINVIPFARENNLLPLKRFFRIRSDTLPGLEAEYHSFAIRLTSPTEGGSTTIRLESALDVRGLSEIFIFDIDVARQNDLQLAKVRTYLDETHADAKNIFETSITDEYRAYLKGESV